MANKKKTQRKRPKKVLVHFRRRRLQIILDKVLIFRFIRQLHGRFWGLAAVNSMAIGLSICFIIRPDLLRIDTAFSDFGNDVRTAPYFAGTMFLAAYGLWRWRNYLVRTLKHSGAILGLISLTVLGLYLIALMPISWTPWPYRIHYFGVTLAGVSMATTVALDMLLSKVPRSTYAPWWHFLRFLSFSCIVIGGWLTFGSSRIIHWYHMSLLGETILLLGYSIWVAMKTYRGEGSQSKMGRLLKSFVFID